MQRHKEYQQAHIESVQIQYPCRVSVCGALLEDVVNGTDLESRCRSASLMFSLRCKRGLGRIEPLMYRLSDSMQSLDEWGKSEEATLFNLLCVAVGRIDSPKSHSLLRRLFDTYDDSRIRGDVLEGMAFEEEQFDWKFVLESVRSEIHISQLLSALYALQFKFYALKFPQEAQELITPFLKDERPMVRVFAIQLLMFNCINKPAIMELADDGHKAVREQVNAAIREWECGLGESTKGRVGQD